MKLAELDLQLNHESDGVCVRMETAQMQADENADVITMLKKENGILRGLVQRQFGQINELNDKVALLTAKSMENNLTITGLEGDKVKGKMQGHCAHLLERYG